MSTSKRSTRNLVIGNGWSAMGAVGFLAARGEEVTWIEGSGAHLIAPLPTLEAGPGVQAWQALCARLGIEGADAQPEPGSYLREFRNKAFREPGWTKAPTPEARREVRDELLWAPEARFASAFEVRLFAPLAELEDRIRAAILARPEVRRIEGIPVSEVHVDGAEPGVLLGSGEEIFAGERLIHADTITPKGFPRPRDRETVSALQAMFTHEELGIVPALEGFYGAINKDAGEEIERSVFGSFLEGGKRSLWTLLLTSAEIEDNHQIAKKLRRMKQSLEKMFAGASFLPAGKTEFMSTITSEHVRFEEHVLFSAGKEPAEPAQALKCKKAWSLTDGFGPSLALHQVSVLLGEELPGLKVADVSEPEEARPARPSETGAETAS